MSGHGGCNQINGGYVLDCDRLQFKGLLSAGVACPEGMEQEQLFVKTLESVRAYQIKGEHLELLDGENGVVARFESRYMP